MTNGISPSELVQKVIQVQQRVTSVKAVSIYDIEPFNMRHKFGDREIVTSTAGTTSNLLLSEYLQQIPFMNIWSHNHVVGYGGSFF
jgi:hypothetical protein